MGHLVYTAICSLNGYVNDTSGRWDWAFPDEHVHQAINDLERGVGTHLYGRRMYEVLSVWETMDDPDPVMQDYAEVWRAAGKIVFSSTLSEVTTSRTRLEPAFDADLVRSLPGTVTIGGPTLAASAMRAGLVDEIHLFLSPVVVDGGTPALPSELRLDLELKASDRFPNGVVHLHYAVS